MLRGKHQHHYFLCVSFGFVLPFSYPTRDDVMRKVFHWQFVWRDGGR